VTDLNAGKRCNYSRQPTNNAVKALFYSPGCLTQLRTLYLWQYCYFTVSVDNDKP